MLISGNSCLIFKFWSKSLFCLSFVSCKSNLVPSFPLSEFGCISIWKEMCIQYSQDSTLGSMLCIYISFLSLFFLPYFSNPHGYTLEYANPIEAGPHQAGYRNVLGRVGISEFLGMSLLETRNTKIEFWLPGSCHLLAWKLWARMWLELIEVLGLLVVGQTGLTTHAPQHASPSFCHVILMNIPMPPKLAH